MACFVCREVAEAASPTGGDYEERNCGQCGRYRLSRSLLVEIESQKLSFDVEATRRWIAVNRVTNPAPTLSSFEAKHHHLLRS